LIRRLKINFPLDNSHNGSILDTMKHTAILRIPTKQFAFLEFTITGTEEEIIDAYLRITSKYEEKQKAWTKDKPPFD